MSYGTVQAEKMTTESGYSLGAGNASSFKNRLINGNMAIDQRNNGSAVTVTNAATSFFGVDRFFANRANGYALSTSTVQQVSDAPAGFVKSVKYTNSTAETPTGAFYSNLQQYIEGLNIADLGWGASGAKSVTLSFWVKISITGTFGGTLRSSAADASYPFSFSYDSANTWQFVSIGIPGPTSGTFYTTTSAGVSVNWDLGVGPSLSASATGAWQAVNALGLTGGTKLNSTAGATYQLTGCQLEVGTVATSFDYRPYGTELNLCQRYFQIVGGTGTEHFAGGVMNSNRVNIIYGLKQTMRASPSFSATSFGSAFSDLTIYWGSAQASCNGTNENYMSPNNVSIGFTHATSSTPGDAGYIYFNSTNARVAFSAEL